MEFVVAFTQGCPGRKVVKPAIANLSVKVIELLSPIAAVTVLQVAKKGNK